MTIQMLPETAPHAHRSSSVGRWAVFLLGVTFYGIGVSGLLWLIASCFGLIPFRGGPIAIESAGGALAFNLGLVALFGIQHAVMARPAFKQAWTRIVPVALERSIFVLLAGVLMATMQWLWQPLPDRIWSVEEPSLRVALLALSGLGWAYFLAATFAIDHFELFGLKQVWRNLRADTTPAPPFVRRLMYRFDRHPIMSGALIGLWVTPDMRLEHLVLAAGMTAYIVVGVAMEERDLIRLHGQDYLDYRASVRTLVPQIGSRQV